MSGTSWERVRFLLFPLGEISVLPDQAMVEFGQLSASAVELLRGTVYYDPLSFAMKRYSAEQSLFPLEVASDLAYWRKLWGYVIQLEVKTVCKGALKIIGPLVDMTNLMWAIRYRVYHHLSEEELINYTLPIGYHVRDMDIRSLAAGADIAQLVERIYPDLENIGALLEDDQNGLSKLEVLLQSQVVQQARAAFLGNPFHIGIPLAFLILSDIEIQDLIVLIEAKSRKLPVEMYRPFLLLEEKTSNA